MTEPLTLDFVALAEHMGTDAVAEALRSFDALSDVDIRPQEPSVRQRHAFDLDAATVRA